MPSTLPACCREINSRSSSCGSRASSLPVGSATATLLSQSQNPPRLDGRGGVSPMFAAQIADPRHQFRVAGGEPCLVESDIVFETGAAMASHFQAPAIDVELAAADAGGGPGGVGL